MTARKKTYYDVTQLVHWSGKLAGIPRVMYELAIRFQKHDPAVVFVSWVKELQSYSAVDLQASLGGRSITYVGTNGQPAAGTGSANTGGFQHQAKRAAKAGLRRSSRIMPKLSAKVEHRLKAQQLQAVPQLEIANGSILFIPWGEWWDDNFIAALKRWHSEKAVQLVPIIHDIGPIVQPQFSGHSTDSLTVYCHEIVPIASIVFTVSQNTKHDLTEWLKSQALAIPRIEVFRLGDDFEVSKPVKPTNEVFQASGLVGNDYIMSVGTIELKKNHMLLYYVYKAAALRGLDLPKLLIVGRPGWRTEAVRALIQEDVDTKNKILLLEDTSDEELSWLYDHCMFTVMPSFYEGWGIPIAESIARGVPCLCSNTSSMVEIAEGIVEHFSPASTDECLAAIRRWLNPKELQAARDKTKQYQPTTWDDSFKQVNTYLKELA